MDFKKLKDLSSAELTERRKEVEKQLSELLSKSSLSSMEKPHLKRSYKRQLAQIETLLVEKK